MIDEQDLIERLKAAGHNVTTQRLLIWRALQDSPAHPSANEIYERLKREHPTVGLATVYNTLELFEDEGVIRAFSVDGVTHYDTDVRPHINLVCERCGQVQDVRDVPVVRWQQMVADVSGFEVTGHKLDFHGLCPRCRHS